MMVSLSIVSDFQSLYHPKNSVFSDMAMLFADLAEVAGRLSKVLSETVTKTGKAVITDLR